jgi:hypothetical protein
MTEAGSLAPYRKVLGLAGSEGVAAADGAADGEGAAGSADRVQDAPLTASTVATAASARALRVRAEDLR